MRPFSNQQSRKLKIVVDTNLFISVFVFRGIMVMTIFELVIDGIISMYVSPALKKELQKKLEFFGVGKQVQDELMLFVNTKGIFIDPIISINESRDKKDNFLLELSEAAQADYLVTRDDDLLIIRKRKGTVIIMPENFLPMLRKMELIE